MDKIEEAFTKNAVIPIYHFVEKEVKVWVSLVKLDITLMTKNSIINKGVFTKSTEVSDMTSSLLILPHCLFRQWNQVRINPCSVVV